jgi:hypothetical protein
MGKRVTGSNPVVISKISKVRDVKVVKKTN